MIDPWASSSVDYDKLVTKFGIKKFSDIVGKIQNPLNLMKRGVIFGHRDFDKMIPLINDHKKFSVVSGMMPSGKMHIGHKMVVDQLKWYFDKGGNLSLPIADMESYAARGIDFKEAKEIAITEYLSNYIALGLDLTDENVLVYLQSEHTPVKDLAFELSKKTNFNELKSIYGFTPSTNVSHLYVPLVQVADILLPQIDLYGGPKHVVVPVGVDQDPHIKLTRDIASKSKDKFKFIQPASTYHRFLTGLTGGKMSSSKPKTAIFLTDPPEVAEKKVKTAKTGGRESLEEQKKLGGCPDKCAVYEMLVYHLIDSDEDLKKIYDDCKTGTLLCGECKAIAAEKMKKIFENLSEKREESLEIAKTIL
ncbi:tryptophan--tRNA ligase [Methanobrevibacter cuticularis]|uniref:Tryptophan--tRNA ligase n=1 Tax=Methanobrevibacter cuticularis TaxID=47311 RepID=A0A166EYK0_9EURY|nr:tryptophan--tRNA ligase [Methanobrevibacter cuticularis]KZX17144.1 tryptophan--tRNA ligase [Methanobrevibacter cuticularis]